MVQQGPIEPAGAEGRAVLNQSSFLPTLLAALAYYNPDSTDPDFTPINIDQELMLDQYDFIVIGGGSAGAVVANRLSEIEGWNVLLLEAGTDETEIYDVPLLAPSNQLSPIDWQYKAEPQSNVCLAMVNNVSNWPRGKVIGGSSVLNYMVYARGNKRDYDNWECQGNPGWGYKDVLPYFKKSEDNKNEDLLATEYHSSGGYQTVQEPPYRTPLADAFVEAGIELGYENRDYNGEYQTGFRILQATSRRGRRCSTNKAFIGPASQRQNLHVSLGSHVLKILIDPETKVAYGVEYERNGLTHIAKATKEVILSGGTIGSAQLLMLSGIGQKEHLQDMEIPVLQDLKVGHNLQDHITLGGFTFTLNESVSIDPVKATNPNSILDYAIHGKGPLTVPATSEALGFVKTKYADETEDYPDIELQFNAGSTNTELCRVHGLKESFYTQVFAPISGQPVWSVLPILLRPRSRGVIKLRSKNPYDHPLIYPNYLADPHDLATMVEGVKITIAISKTKSFERFGSQFYDVPWPGCDHLEPYTDPMWECMIRHYTQNDYHHVGTAKMGPSSDPEAVVDPQLRVYGIKKLRVVDASIMPTHVSGNTNAAVIMIGEKASDMIKESWKKQNSEFCF